MREMKRRAIIQKLPEPELDASFLSAERADVLLNWCLHRVNWGTEEVSLFGRRHTVPRLTAWYGEPGTNYRYSGQDHPGDGVPEALQPLTRRLNANHVLLNRYRAGGDYMGWHRDDERGVSGPVHIVSVGASRTLRWRFEGCRKSQAVPLSHGSKLSIDGRLPHTLTRTRRAVGERVSLSFRCIADG